MRERGGRRDRRRELRPQMCLDGDVTAYTGMTRARYLCVFWGAGVAEGAGVGAR